MIKENPAQPEQMDSAQVGTLREKVGTAGLRVVGIDPGLGHLGIAVVYMHPFHVDLFVVGTKAAQKKRRLRVMDDMADRVHELARAVLSAAGPDEPGLLAFGIEATAIPFGKTSAKTIQGLGRVRGMVDGVTASFNVPVVEETPQGLKKWACGASNASKADIIQSVQQKLPGLRWPEKEKDWEHAADALVAALIAAESAPVTAALRAVGVEYRAPWRD